ncbi:hypothetical protein DRQ53_04625 [bacterium]|nr:MAG: hypothetical protein DRQ53_04625 [bacterium]
MAVSSNTVFLGESESGLVDLIYVVAAEDAHGNISLPSPVATGLVPVTVYLEEYDIELTWHGDDQNGTRVGSGVYFVVLTSNEGTQAQKVMLMK